MLASPRSGEAGESFHVGMLTEIASKHIVGQVSDRGLIVGYALRVLREVRIVAEQRKEARTQS